MAKDRVSRRARLPANGREDSGLTDKKRDSSASFAEEYAYVLKDLRWVFILAAVMFVFLIVLNLVLQ